ATSLIVTALACAPSNADTLFGGVCHSELLPPLQTQYLRTTRQPQRGRLESTNTSAQGNRSVQRLGSLPAEQPNQAPFEDPTSATTPERQTSEKSVVWVSIPKSLAGKWMKM